ncbi:MAG: TRAP transporter substrate-binding protein [Candidatus Anammoxibacter sp.]
MKRRVLFCLISLFIISLRTAGFDPVFAEPPKIVKFATLAPQGSVWLNVVDDIAEEIRKKSEGKLRFKIYAGGIAGDEIDILRKMMVGQLHCAGFTSMGLGEILSEVRVFDLPFFFNEYDEIDFIKNKLNDRFTKEFEDKGFILLGWADVGFVYLFSNKKIDTMEALRSTKMWIWGRDPVAKALFDSIGLSPVPLSVTDVMTSLQTGLIDSFYASPLGAVALQWFTKTKYMLDLPLANSVGAILMSKKYYDSIEPDLQVLLKTVFKTNMERLTILTRDDNKESIEVIRKSGVELISLSDENLKEFKMISKKASEIVEGKLFPPALIADIKRDLEEFRRIKELGLRIKD